MWGRGGELVLSFACTGFINEFWLCCHAHPYHFPTRHLHWSLCANNPPWKIRKPSMPMLKNAYYNAAAFGSGLLRDISNPRPAPASFILWVILIMMEKLTDYMLLTLNVYRILLQFEEGTKNTWCSWACTVLPSFRGNEKVLSNDQFGSERRAKN